MPKWIQVVIVIIVFFIVAGTYERWRVRAMDTWCRARNFTPIDPFVPAEHPFIPALVSQVTGHGDGLTRRYASALSGMAGDTQVTLVEFEYTPTGRKTSAWFTLAVWQAAARAPGPMVLIPLGDKALDKVTRKVSGTEGSLFVNAKPETRQAWLTEKRRRALEEWTHGGQFLLVDDYAGWVTEGLLTAARADQLLAQVPEARRILDE